MSNLVVLVTAIIFYILGRTSGKEPEALQAAKKTVKSFLPRRKAGVIDYPTPQELHYRGSETEAINNEAKRLLKQAGLT